MLSRSERYFGEEPPPERRLVATAAEAADALNAILRELDNRESLRPEVATTTLTAEHITILRALQEASPAPITQIDGEWAGACRRVIGHADQGPALPTEGAAQ